MRKIKDKTARSFTLLTTIILALVIAIIVANIVFNLENWKEVLFGLLNDILSVSIVGVVATIFTKIISDNYYKIKKNNQKLASFGIDKIGDGRSTLQDEKMMFGSEKSKKYPYELKLLFISGNGFFKKYQNLIENCLSKSDCKLKVLLMSMDKSNAEYVARNTEVCPQTIPYKEQVEKTSLPILKRLYDKFGDRVEVRFYKDEYRYNYRLAVYNNENEEIETYCWVNVQPLNKDAVDLSVCMRGQWRSEDEQNEDSLALNLNESFENLWNKYSDSKYNFDCESFET